MAASICQSCALCCDGTLFRTFQEDAPSSKIVAQPCACLHGRVCGVYGDRPVVCRAFECRVLMSLNAGMLDITSAQCQIATARSLLADLDALLPQDLTLATTALDDVAMRYHGAWPAGTDAQILLQIAAIRIYLDRHFRPEPPA